MGIVKGNFQDVLNNWVQKNGNIGFTNAQFKILPPEQIKTMVKSIVEANNQATTNNQTTTNNGSGANKGTQAKQKSQNIISLENMRKAIFVKKLIYQYERAKILGRPIELNELIMSDGGSKSIEGDGETEINKSNSKVAYLAIKCGDIVIFEPVGQPGNATFIGKAEDLKAFETIIRTKGRKAALESGLVFKVTHDKTVKAKDVIPSLAGTAHASQQLYDYASNHCSFLVEIAVMKPDVLLKALEKIKSLEQQYCNLTTLQSQMPKTTRMIKARISRKHQISKDKKVKFKKSNSKYKLKDEKTK